MVKRCHICHYIMFQYAVSSDIETSVLCINCWRGYIMLHLLEHSKLFSPTHYESINTHGPLCLPVTRRMIPVNSSKLLSQKMAHMTRRGTNHTWRPPNSSSGDKDVIPLFIILRFLSDNTGSSFLQVWQFETLYSIIAQQTDLYKKIATFCL